MAKNTRKSKKHARIDRATLRKIARDVARFVERLFPKNGKGKEKRAIAVDLINNAVDLPFIDEGTEAEIIGNAIDAAVSWLNTSRRRWER